MGGYKEFYTRKSKRRHQRSHKTHFLTIIIDAIEGKDKANAKIKDEVLMKITGKEVDLFCEIDLSLAEFVVMKKSQKILYAQLEKALYGCVQSALLWYKLYLSTLKDMGFELNSYNICVANKKIEGKQCTV